MVSPECSEAPLAHADELEQAVQWRWSSVGGLQPPSKAILAIKNFN